MSKLWWQLRPHLADLKKKLLHRPFGMKSFGWGSAIIRPHQIVNREKVEIGSRTLIQPNSFIMPVRKYEGTLYNPSIRIGDDVYIGRQMYLTAIQAITIGDGCVLSEQVYITDLLHGFDPDRGLIMKQQLVSKGPVCIGPHCFVGFRVAVMPGVTLGERCVVGANSVVTRSFPAYSMIAGTPARLVKTYSHELKDWVTPSNAALTGEGR